MATSGNRGGGRRSKGERRFVGSRIPVKQAEQLDLVVKHEGLTLSDLIAVAIEEKLGTYDLKMLSDEHLIDLLVEGISVKGQGVSDVEAQVVVDAVIIEKPELRSDRDAGLLAAGNPA